MKTGKLLIGIPKYMSSWSHLGLEQGRDDMESIGSLIIFFLKARLPWRGLKGENKDRYHRIGKLKKETVVESLCNGIPESFVKYLRYVRSLEFDEEPNYVKLNSFFNELKIDSKVKYDWEDKRVNNPSDNENGSQFSTQTVGQRTVQWITNSSICHQIVFWNVEYFHS